MKNGYEIAHYRVIEKIGAGAMGEVFRARDTKLGRDVALKILPQDFALDPARVSRFRREARLLAALNHPHIAAIHDFQESGDVRCLVLELVEGVTLADMLSEKSLEPSRAVSFARQLALALDAAHREGIIHRDLKPSNIRITPDGTLKVLDFGLAKHDVQPSTSDQTTATETIGGTRPGMILGTPAYMSPEQARGQTVDKRADIWAYGCVLFEMFSGERSFHGETPSDTIAKVLTTEPDWMALRPRLPQALERLLRRCLQKDPERRLRDMGDALLDLEDAVSEVPAPSTPEKRSRSVRIGVWVGFAVALVIAIVAGFFLGHLRNRSAKALAPVVSFEVIPSEGIRLPVDEGSCFAIDPSGRRVAYVGAQNDERRLYLRRLDQVEATPLPGTEGAISPFFSPDGEQIAFFAGGRLKRYSLRDQSLVTVWEAASTSGGCWAEDDTIIFSPGEDRGLFAVPAKGGIPRSISHIETHQRTVEHQLPVMLPDPTFVLFVIHSQWAYDDPSVAVLNRQTGEHQVLVENASSPVYVPTGHLAFVRDGSLLAVPFDPERLKVTGEPLTAIDHIFQSAGREVALSSEGSLVYLSSRGSQPQAWERQDGLTWVDREGNLQPLSAPPGAYYLPTLSQDGEKLAVTVFEPRNYDLWARDLRRGATSRLTHEGNNHVAVWTTGDSRIIFTSDRDGPPNLYRKSLDGSTPVERLTEGPHHQDPISISPDDRFLTFWDNPPETGGDIMLLDLVERTGPTPLLATKFDESHGMISPDGNYIAYTSDESGRHEVYVQPFPELGERTQISIDGGHEPRWNPQGGELFFWSVTNQAFMAVEVDSADGFRVGIPRPLFTRPFRRHLAGIPNYDVAPDGRRFLMIDIGDIGEPAARLTITRNWGEEVRRRSLGPAH